MPASPLFNDPNGRIFYACQAVLTVKRNTRAESDPTDGVFLTGVQSIGINGDMPSQSLLDVGRFQRSFNYYGQQNFEITIERVIDQSHDFFYFVDPTDYLDGSSGYRTSHILHQNNLHSKGTSDFEGKSLRNYDITILYTPDKFKYIGSDNDKEATEDTDGDGDVDADDIIYDPDGDKVISVTYKSCLLSSVSYDIGVDGVRETVTLFTKQLRFNKDFTTLSAYGINDDLPSFPNPSFNPSQPIHPVTNPKTILPNTLKRNDLDILKQDVDRKSRLPQEVISMFEVGNTDATYIGDDGATRALKIYGITNINVSFEIGYNQLPDIGFWRGSEKDKEYEQNIFTHVSLPIQVTCSFTGVARRAMEYGEFVFNGPPHNPDNATFLRNTDTNFGASGVMDRTTGLSIGGGPYAQGIDTNNLGVPPGNNSVYKKADRPIRLVFEKFPNAPVSQYHVIDLGNKNYLTSISTSGGDAGGGNVETTITYQNNHSDIVLVRDTNVRNLINTSTL